MAYEADNEDDDEEVLTRARAEEEPPKGITPWQSPEQESAPPQGITPWQPPAAEEDTSIPEAAQYTAGVPPWTPPKQAQPPAGITPWSPPTAEAAEGQPPAGIKPWEPPHERPEAEGVIGTAAREAAGATPAALGGLAVGAGAAGFGRMAGATLGRVLGGVGGAWGGPGGAALGWLGGGIAGGYIGEQLAQGIKSLLGFDDDTQRAANREANPMAAAIGQVAPLALGLSPGRGIQAGARLLSGGIGGAIEGATQVAEGDYSKERMAANIIGGILLPGNKQWLTNIEERAAARAGGPRPVAAAPPPPATRPGELDLTEGRPGTSGGPQRELEIGGVEPGQPRPQRDTSTGQRQLPLEQEAEVGRGGQYELPVEPRTQRDMFREDELGRARERPGEAAPAKPSTAPDTQTNFDLTPTAHGSPGPKADTPVAEAPAPPLADKTHGPENWGKKPPPAEGAATGINVTGVDPTLAHAIQAKAPAQQAGILKDLEPRVDAILKGPSIEAAGKFREIGEAYRQVGQNGQAAKYEMVAKELDRQHALQPPTAATARPAEVLRGPEPAPAATVGDQLKARQAEKVAATAAKAEGIPFMVTRKMKADLAKHGFTPEQVSEMTPAQAHEALRAAARGSEPAAPALAGMSEKDLRWTMVNGKVSPATRAAAKTELQSRQPPTVGDQLKFQQAERVAAQQQQQEQPPKSRIAEFPKEKTRPLAGAPTPDQFNARVTQRLYEDMKARYGAERADAWLAKQTPELPANVTRLRQQQQQEQPRKPLSEIPLAQALRGTGESHPGYRWHVIDRHTGEVMGEYANARRAQGRADKLDSDYGAVRYQVKATPEIRQQQQQEQPGRQPIRPNTVRTHDGAVFTGATVNEAAANAAKAGYRPGQIFRPRETAAPPRETAGAPPREPPPPGGGRELPPDTGGPYAPPPLETRRFDVIRSAGEKIVRRYKETFQPEIISPIAQRAEPLFRKGMTERANDRDMAVQETKEGTDRWRKIPEEDRYKLISDIERGRPVDPKYVADAPDIRRMLQETHDLEKVAGLKAAYRKDYFPHEFDLKKDQEPIQDFFTRTLGPNWFLKGRTIDLVEQAVKAGYRLKDSNPYAAVRSRMLASADLRMQKGLLDDLRNTGLAGVAGDNEKTNALLRKAGWQAINGPDGKQWMLHPDVQPLWKNAIAGKGMWSDPGITGDAFRAWMQFKAFTVPLKLAFSGFHALHMGHINFSTNMARSFGQMANGEFEGAVRSMGQAFSTTFRPKAVVGGAEVRPHDIQEQWNWKEKDRHPDVNMAIGYLKEAGIVPHMSEQLRSDAEVKLRQAAEDRNPFGVAFHAPRELIRRIQAPMFEQWIPRMKIAAALNDIGAVLDRNPDYHTNASDRRLALSAIGKSADDKFGEMFYDGLFWNKMLKDTSIGSMLSLGWNLGFVRQFGGAAMEAVSRPLGKVVPALAPSAERKIIRDATNKIAFASTYMGTALMIGGMMTKMMSGEDPKEMNDYIFPRVGGINPDGSPRRLTTMFYTREIPMLGKHIEEHGGGIGGMLQGVSSMVWNKTMFQPFLELMQNRSYFGSEIWNPKAPAYEQLMQQARHFLGNQLLPMTYTGAQRAEETMGVEPKWYPTTAQGALAYAGFGPAPAYADKSALQNHITHLFQQHVAPADRPYEDPDVQHEHRRARDKLLMAIQSGDPGARQSAYKEAIATGMKPAQLAKLGKTYSDQNMFQRLPQADQIEVLERATPEEHQRYWQYVNAKTRVQWVKEHPVRTQ